MAPRKAELARGFNAGTPGQAPAAPLSRPIRTFIEGKPGGTSKMRRDGGPEMERVGSVYLPKTLATDLRVRCAQRRQSLSDAVTEAVTLWLHDATEL